MAYAIEVEDPAPSKPGYERIHVYPLFGREHLDSPQCWCSPWLNFTHSETGNEVWVHRADN